MAVLHVRPSPSLTPLPPYPTIGQITFLRSAFKLLGISEDLNWRELKTLVFTVYGLRTRWLHSWTILYVAEFGVLIHHLCEDMRSSWMAYLSLFKLSVFSMSSSSRPCEIVLCPSAVDKQLRPGLKHRLSCVVVCACTSVVRGQPGQSSLHCPT